MIEQGSTLAALVEQSAQRWPERVAVEETGGETVTYRELVALADGVCGRLQGLGVEAGDRVGINLCKSIDAVATVLGVLRAGATYVPVDPLAPASRNLRVLRDCAPRVVVAEGRHVEGLRSLEGGGATTVVAVAAAPGGRGVGRLTTAGPPPGGAAPGDAGIDLDPDRLAYILYTSGTTGEPKGVMHTNRGAMSFVRWCSDTFAPAPEDCFASHAPFHFDLSVLDLFVALGHGSRLLLLDEEVVRNPAQLASVAANRRVSVWYSVPSALNLLVRYGRLERHDWSALRLVLFAGEVFPVAQLRHLMSLLPRPRYFNLFGPTETNVCTAYELPASIPDTRKEHLPIGETCSHLRTMVVDPEGDHVVEGEGELCVTGPAVMSGYWGRPRETGSVFIATDSDRWYRTGDLVRRDEHGTYLFLGRRDRMVKRRGFRVELGEIEVGLGQHPAVSDVAVVAATDDESGVVITAYLVCPAERPSLIELKRFGATELPASLAPDRFLFLTELPRTSTGKVDYRGLEAKFGAE